MLEEGSLMLTPTADLRLACLDVLNDDARPDSERLGAAAALKALNAFLPPDEALVARSIETAMRITHLPFAASCLAEVVAHGPSRPQVEQGLLALFGTALREGQGALAWDALKTLLSTAPDPSALGLDRVAQLAGILLALDDPRPLASMIRFFDVPKLEVPLWARDAIFRRRELLDGLDDVTLEHVHFWVPTVEGWLLLAHRSSVRTRYGIASAGFGERLPQGQQTLRQALECDLGRDDRVIASWLRRWESLLLSDPPSAD